MVTILHLSDLHFGSEELVYTHSELGDGLHPVLSSTREERVYVLITGDITFQGRPKGYDEARQFIGRYISDHLENPKRLLLCPGNHDIVQLSRDPFAPFDSFSYSLRSDRIFTYSDNNYVIWEDDEVLFLGINTAYRVDHRYGAANVKAILDGLADCSPRENKLKIAFLHHHLINQFEGDTSVLRNAYDVLSLLDAHEFDYIFHGHQHSNQSMPIGESRMRIFGVRSFNFKTAGYPNGFNTYRASRESIIVENHTYSRDVLVSGRVGGFRTEKEEYQRESNWRR